MMKGHRLIENQEDIDRLFEVFFNYVRLLTDIPQSDQDHCRLLFKPVYAPKGTLLEREGTRHQYHNFIVTGYIRNYHVDDEGREHTVDINDGPRFFTSYNHFIQQTVSDENLHCITDCEMLRISRADVEKARDLGITSQEYSEKILQYHLEASRQRAINLSTLSAKERYLKLLQNHPSIVQNVPLVHIASYLGINPGSLSRIRQELSQ